jgi:hypothetical protein
LASFGTFLNPLTRGSGADEAAFDIVKRPTRINVKSVTCSFLPDRDFDVESFHANRGWGVAKVNLRRRNICTGVELLAGKI